MALQRKLFKVPLWPNNFFSEKVNRKYEGIMFFYGDFTSS